MRTTVERFDGRGVDGEPSWWLYIELAPEEMGKVAGGTPGAFVIPPPRSYAYSGPPTAMPGPMLNSLVARPLLKNDADPIYDLLGPGRISHAEEWETTLDQLRKEGVEIIHRKGAMAYGPSPSSGKPGQLLLDKDASIGALRHEAQHYADDKQLGFPGAIRYYQEPMLRWQTEYRAYMKEVNLTRQIRRFETGQSLVNNAREERKYLIENFGLKL